MSRWSKHISVGEPLKVNGEEFVLKPLGTEDIPAFLRLYRKILPHMKEGKEVNMAEVFANFSDIEFNDIKYLIEKTLDISYPTDNKDEKAERNQFGLKYFMNLLPKIFEINSAKGKEGEKSDKIDKLIKQVNSQTK